MAELFQKNSDTIDLHIRNIYNEGELAEKSTTEESWVVQEEGKRKVTGKVKNYNLDVIISIGYRVKSQSGTQFRIWANERGAMVLQYQKSKSRCAAREGAALLHYPGREAGGAMKPGAKRAVQ